MERSILTFDEKLKTSSKISTIVLAKSSIDGSFKRRTREKIIRAEARPIKKKWDRITLIVAASLIILVGILIIIQNQIAIFPEDSYMIPLILLIALLVISIVFAIEYFIVRKEGSKNLLTKYSTVEDFEKELLEYQKSNTFIYNVVKKTFDLIHDGDSKFLLATLTLKNLFDLHKSDNETINEKKLFRYLVLIISNKKASFNKLLETDEEGKVYLEVIDEYLKLYKVILKDLKDENRLPVYFYENVEKMDNAIIEFSTQPS